MTHRFLRVCFLELPEADRHVRLTSREWTETTTQSKLAALARSTQALLEGRLCFLTELNLPMPTVSCGLACVDVCMLDKASSKPNYCKGVQVL